MREICTDVAGASHIFLHKHESFYWRVVSSPVRTLSDFESDCILRDRTRLLLISQLRMNEAYSTMVPETTVAAPPSVSWR